MTEQNATTEETPARPKTVRDIIKLAGGPAKIEEASLGGGGEAVRADAVYKWTKIGIPDRHWWIVKSLCDVTADELYRANNAARGVQDADAPKAG